MSDHASCFPEHYRGFSPGKLRAELARRTQERDDLVETLQLIRIKLGIRESFVPLGAALEIEPIIKDALANLNKTDGE